MRKLYSEDNSSGSGKNGNDWTQDLGEMIEQQTMHEASLGQESNSQRGRRHHDRSYGIQNEDLDDDLDDGALFDELDEGDREEGRFHSGEESTISGMRNRTYGSNEESYGDEPYDDDDDSFEEQSKSRKEKKREKKEEKEYREYQAYKEGKKKAKKKKRWHRIRKFLIILLVVLLLLYALLSIALRLLGIQSGLDVSSIKSLISEEASSNAAMSGYTNIALFGVDSRDEDLGEGNRTDVMIIASINNSSGDIKLVSVYRDTYLDIGDGDYEKANAAYSYGGAEQAITMLNTNLDLNITDYVTIGFAGVADLIDAVGGVEIEVSEDEIEHLNNYQATMAEELGMEYIEVTTTGTQTLNGLQAVAYCRIRYTDGGDFERTERQKEVLTQAFTKLKSSGPITIIQAATDLSDEIETSLSMTEIASLAMKVFKYEITDTNGFPNEDMRTTGYIGDASCVIPITLSSNVVWLHEYLFDDEDYTVSSTVQTISDYISSVTGYY